MRAVLSARGLPRDRDADADALDARGRARLPRAGAAAAGQLLRAAAVAAALQAAADGRRASSATSRSRAASATRTCAPTASPSSRSSTSRCRSSSEDDVIDLMETLMARVFAVSGFDVAAPPFPRMPYDEAMERYGSDRPDLRFGLEIARPLRRARRGPSSRSSGRSLDAGGVVRGFNVRARARCPRKELDELTEMAQRYGAKGLVWAFVQDGGVWRSPVAKFLADEEMRRSLEPPGRLGGRPAAGRRRPAPRVAADVLGALRLRPRGRLGLTPERPRAAVGRRLPDVRVERGRGALGRRCTTRSRRRRRGDLGRPRARCARAPTTSC